MFLIHNKQIQPDNQQSQKPRHQIKTNHIVYPFGPACNQILYLFQSIKFYLLRCDHKPLQHISKQHNIMERNTQTRRLVNFFKQFVNTTLLKHFRSSESTTSEWNYFSSLISQESLDMNKIELYLNLVSTKEEPFSPTRVHGQIKSKPEENQKTNSGIYGKKGETTVEMEKLDFQPNRTMGGNLDRVRYAVGSQKPNNMYMFDSKEKKKGERGNEVKVGGGGIAGLIEGMTSLNNGMLENHLRLEGKSEGLVVPGGQSSYNNNNSSSNNIYRYRPDQRYPL